MGEKSAQDSRNKRDSWKLLSINVAGVTLCVLVSLAFNAMLFWHSEAALLSCQRAWRKAGCNRPGVLLLHTRAHTPSALHMVRSHLAA